MEIIAAEPRLVAPGGFVRLFLVPGDDRRQEICYVRFRRLCPNGREVLFESIVEAHLVFPHPEYAYVDCKIPTSSTLLDVTPVICVTVSTDGRFPLKIEHLTDKIALGELASSEITFVAPMALQVYSSSSVLVAIHESHKMRYILPLLALSSSFSMRLNYFNEGLDKTLELGAHLYPVTLAKSTNLKQGNILVAAYLESYLSCLPECTSARVAVSLDRLHFVDCGAEISILPSFSIIHTLPPVVNSMDTAGLVILCSASTSLIPVKGRFPDTLPKCWYLDISSSPLSVSSPCKIQMTSTRTQLPVILSQPRQDEIQMLESLVALRKHKHYRSARTRSTNLVTLSINQIKLTLSQSRASICRFALFETELELSARCLNSMASISIGSLRSLDPKVLTVCAVSMGDCPIADLPKNACMLAMRKTFKSWELSANIDPARQARPVALRIPIKTNLPDDIMSSVLEVSVILRRRATAPSSKSICLPTAAEAMAHGCIPMSCAERHEPSCREEVESSSRPLTIKLDTSHPFCSCCALNARVAISDSDLPLVSSSHARSTMVYAFRSCGVRVAKHNMDGCLLINLRASSTHTMNLPLTPLPNELFAVNHSNLTSFRRQVHAFEEQDWMVQEAIPNSTLIEREVEIEVRGSDFKHALESSLRVCLELEDGKILETPGRLADDSTIIFKTPYISEAQMAKLRVAFDFGNATLWSNPLLFEFYPYPKLLSLCPIFVPNSTGGTLTLHGDNFRKADALHVFFTPIEVSYNNLTSSVMPAASAYSDLSRHAIRPGIAPAFAAAMQVRAIGGTSAAAAAAAAAASVTSASGTDFENMDAMVSDAVRATGGTKAVATVASHTVAQIVTTRNDARNNILDKHRAEARGVSSQHLQHIHMLYGTAGAQNTDIQESEPGQLDTINITTTLRPCKFGYHQFLSVNFIPNDDGSYRIKVPTHFVDSNKITCIFPPHLPVHAVHVDFSKSPGGGNEIQNRSVSLFTVRRLHLVSTSMGFLRLGWGVVACVW